MTLITLPYNEVEGGPSDISEVMADFDAIVALLNGGLQDDNVAADAALLISKLKNYPNDVTKHLKGNGSWGVLTADEITSAVMDTDVTMAANSNTKFPSQAAVKAYAAASAQPAWTNATMLNGWVSVGWPYAPVGYYKDTLGIVHLRGVIDAGTHGSGTECIDLPVGYRPEYVIETIQPGATSAQISISGPILMFYGAQQAAVNLDNIHFRAA